MSEAESIPGPTCGLMDHDEEDFHEPVPEPTRPPHALNEREMAILFLQWPSKLHKEIQ
jgi:hypothetical protein